MTRRGRTPAPATIGGCRVHFDAPKTHATLDPRNFSRLSANRLNGLETAPELFRSDDLEVLPLEEPDPILDPTAGFRALFERTRYEPLKFRVVTESSLHGGTALVVARIEIEKESEKSIEDGQTFFEIAAPPQGQRALWAILEICDTCALIA